MYDFIFSFIDPVKLINFTQNQRVRINANAATNLTCLFKSRNASRVNVTWSKRDEEDYFLSHSHHKEMTIDSQRIQTVLYIHNISHNANGTYICSAYDGKVTESKEVPLFVLGE